MKCIQKKQQKRKKDDPLSASYLWLTRAQNFDHGSYIALVKIIIRQRWQTVTTLQKL